jgi:tetratricopeptide (TPR) repeat protein
MSSLSTVLAQSEEAGYKLNSEARKIEMEAQNRASLEEAIKKYQAALAMFEKVKSDRGKRTALCNLGETYFNLGQYGESRECYDQSLLISQKIRDTTGEGESLNGLGLVYRALSEYSKAIDHFDRSLQIRKRIGDTKGEGSTTANLGEVYWNVGQSTKALECYQQSLLISRSVGDAKVEGESLNGLGLVYRALGEYSKAQEYFHQALEVREKIGDVRGQGTSINNIAVGYFYVGQYPKSLEYFERSLIIKRKIGDLKDVGINLNNIGLVYYFLGQDSKALEYFEESLQISKRIGDVKGEGSTLESMGLVHEKFGKYSKALEYFQKSLEMFQNIGDIRSESNSLNNIALVYKDTGQYSKSLKYSEQSLQIYQMIKDAGSEGVSLSNIGLIYRTLGQYSKALEYLDQSLKICKKVGDIRQEGTTLNNIASTYAQQGNYIAAIKAANESLAIQLKIGLPTSGITDDIANHYLDAGDVASAEPLIAQTQYYSTRGRLALIKSEFRSAISYYSKQATWGENTGNSDVLFMSYSGLGRAYEGIEDYSKAEEFYQKAMNIVEEIRSGLLPSERKNFFQVKVGGFQRSEPAKGLTRVRMKVNHPDGSIESSEVTRGRSFADHLAENSSAGSTGIPGQVMEKEQSLVYRVAALKKELANTDKEKQSAKHEILSNEVKDGQNDLNAFIDNLWKRYPAYAAVKYPRPITLKESALNPDECVVVFDVSEEGIGVKLIRNKRIAETFFKNWDQKEFEKDIKKFRESFEKAHFRDFDSNLAESLYRKLLLRVLDDVPKGTPLVIIPDGILALLPFEALVTGGKLTWKRSGNGIPYPEGLTFLGDEHPITYYQSITALTLVRTMANQDGVRDTLLVVADPVFEMEDNRAPEASSAKPPQNDVQFCLQMMQTIEDSDNGGLIFKRLTETGTLADKLVKMYGADCLSLTGLQANKEDFLSKIGPKIEQYGSLVFATHGVMSTHVPGLMEPFLALTMTPPGTDGFLKMSDILSLKMNADVVALTACQSGLGKELSGEGVMSMGRAFQYAGAKSVLMSLWKVEEKSATSLAESFFKYRKQGKTKLESLKAARDDIRIAGYKHPFFWSAFILVGESS